MINLDYPLVLEMLADLRDQRRADSAAYLIWYLENYFRLTRDEAIDCVGDKPGDQGVDAIWVNEPAGIVYIFQSRLIQDRKKTVGDAMLKPFAGTLRLFDTPESVEHMLTGGSSTILNRIRDLDIASKIGKYSVRGEFLTNLNIDENGKRYLRSIDQITFVGKEYLETRYISSDRDIPIHSPATFALGNQDRIAYKSGSVLAIVAPARAADLIQLEGIADQSLFAPNVRGPLGKTDINKALVKSIESKDLHSLFPLFHNGITIVAGKVDSKKTAVTTSNR